MDCGMLSWSLVADLLDERSDKLLVGLAGKVQISPRPHHGVTLGSTGIAEFHWMTLPRYMALATPWMMWPFSRQHRSCEPWSERCRAGPKKEKAIPATAVSLVHVLTGLMVASIGLGQPLNNLADAVRGVGVGERAQRRR